METKVQIPAAFADLFKPCRYKVYWGGRGGAKSWAFARALLLRAASEPTIVLCARELQKSIKDSVHALLDQQIRKLGLEAFFEVIQPGS
jgi:phage terminase large subunit